MLINNGVYLYMDASFSTLVILYIHTTLSVHCSRLFSSIYVDLFVPATNPYCKVSSNVNTIESLSLFFFINACGALKCENASICEKVAKCEKMSTLNVKKCQR